MQNIILLLVCLLIGIGLRTAKLIPDNAHTTLNTFIIYVAFPALVLAQIHHLHADGSLLYAILMPWIIFCIGAAVFWCIGQVLGFRREAIGAIMLTGGLGNTAFIGVPMIEAFYGKSGMATGVLIDTLGTYLVLSTLGITIACIYSYGSTNARAIAKRVLTFPPLVAVFVAVLLLPFEIPALVDDVLNRLGGTLAPLALVSVGLQLRFNGWQSDRSALAIGLSYKLIAAPALIAILYVVFLHLSGGNLRVTLLESAMGPQIGAAIVATQYGLAPELVTMMVGAGTIMAFVTLPGWWQAIFLMAV